MLDVFLAGFTKENATMAFDRSALTDLLDALRAGGDMDVFAVKRYSSCCKRSSTWRPCRFLDRVSTRKVDGL